MTSSVRKTPLRKCTGCNEMKPKKSLLRIVFSEEAGTMSIDPTGKQNGRGAYICKDIACFERARKNKGLERSFKKSVPTQIYESVRQELAEHIESDGIKQTGGM